MTIVVMVHGSSKGESEHSIGENHPDTLYALVPLPDHSLIGHNRILAIHLPATIKFCFPLVR